MQPRPIRPVLVTLKPLSLAKTTLDPVFKIPVDQAGDPAAPTYGSPITIRAQFSFSTYKAHREKAEGDQPATSGSMTIMAEDMPAVDIRDARVTAVAGTTLNPALIIKELRPGGWTAGGKASLYRATLEEAENP